MADTYSKEQIDVLDEMLRRDMLQGERAAVAREVVRRSRGGNTNARAAEIARLGNSGTGAFMSGFANAATLGLADRAVDAINAGARRLGIPALSSEERGQVETEQAADHPISSAAGSVAGALAGGAIAGGAAARLGIRPAQRLAGRVGQYAAGGAGAGAAEQAIREGELSGDTMTAGVIGGVAGALGGTAAEKVLPIVAPKVSRAWRKLANKLQTPVEDMAAFMADTQRATGRMPSIAQAIHARDQGILQGWAGRHNTLGTAFDDAARRAPGEDLSAGHLRRMRNDRMDADMGAQRSRSPDGLPATGREPPVRDTSVTISDDLLESPHVHDALRGPKMKDIRIKIGEGSPLTVSDVDRLRQKLRAMQKAEPGGPFGDFADQLRDDTAAQVPEYGEALDTYRRATKFIEGFDEGKAGRAASEVEDTIQSPEGLAGLDAGTRTRQGQRTLRNIAPTVPSAEDELGLAGSLGRAGSYAAAGSKALGVFHGLRAMMDVLPQSYQRELADGLLTRDPAKIHATLGKMRKAGADLQNIRQLSTGLSAVLGVNSSQALGSEGARS